MYSNEMFIKILIVVIYTVFVLLSKKKEGIVLIPILGGIIFSGNLVLNTILISIVPLIFNRINKKIVFTMMCIYICFILEGFINNYTTFKGVLALVSILLFMVFSLIEGKEKPLKLFYVFAAMPFACEFTPLAFNTIGICTLFLILLLTILSKENSELYSLAVLVAMSFLSNNLILLLPIVSFAAIYSTEVKMRGSKLFYVLTAILTISLYAFTLSLQGSSDFFKITILLIIFILIKDHIQILGRQCKA